MGNFHRFIQIEETNGLVHDAKTVRFILQPMITHRYIFVNSLVSITGISIFYTSNLNDYQADKIIYYIAVLE